MTVASLATTTHSRPLIRPMPVTMPALGTASRPSLAPYIPVRRQRAELEERAARVEQAVDPVADQQLAAVGVLGPGLVAATSPHHGEPLAELVGHLTQSTHPARLAIVNL